MKFYNKKFVKIALDRQSIKFVENRDAVIWEVDEANRICRVKIQGTNTLVIVNFPQNQKIIPSWLRIGNSVRIFHRSGIRGHMTIIGQGTTIPTPVSGDTFPTPDALPDAILTGCEITVTTPESMAVAISSGTYRINEVIYNLFVSSNPLLFGQTPELLFGRTPELFFGGDIIKFLDTAPSAGIFRYDAFCVGINGIVDYLKGTESTTPSKPTIPSEHLLIYQYILVIGGATKIKEENIGMIWSVPVVSSIEIDIEGDGISHDLAWDSGDPQYTEVDIVFNVLNQYNNLISGSYTLTLTMVTGAGDLWSGDIGYNATTVTQIVAGSTYTFKYRREQAIDSGVVVFSATLVNGSNSFELIGIINLEAFS